MWTAGGPYGGTVEAILVDPVNPAVIYAGTRAGLFKSIDGGTNWSRKVSGLADLWIRSLAINSDSGAVYAGSGLGLHRSADGGTSWEKVFTRDPDFDSTALAIEIPAADPSTIYVATTWGIFRSLDAGQTWTQIFDLAQVFDIAAAPSEPNTLYALTNSGVFMTTDGGLGWDPVSLEVSPSSIAVDPTDPDIAYASAGSLYKTVDGGARWARVGEGIEGSLSSIHVVPSAPSTLYAGGRSGRASYTARSDDGGAHWSTLADLPGGVLSPVLGVDPTEPEVLYAGPFGHGLFKSTDGGAAFMAANEGLAAGWVTALDIDPADPQVIYSGLEQAGLFRSADGGATWRSVTQGLREPSDPTQNVVITDVTVDPGPPSAVFVARVLGDFDGVVPPVLKSLDGGGEWVPASGGLPVGARVRDLEVDPRSSGTLFAAVDKVGNDLHHGGLYATNDGGESWSLVGPNEDPVVALAARAEVNTVAIAAGSQFEGADLGLFVSTDWGGGWQEISYPGGLGHVGALALGPSGTTIYAGSSAATRIAKSTDRGVTWREIAVDRSNLASHILELKVDPANPSEIYAGTQQGGLWISTDGGETWQALAPGVLWLRTDPIAFWPSSPDTAAAFQVAMALGEQTASETPDLAVAMPVFTGTAGRARSGVWRVIPAPDNYHRPAISGRPRSGLVLRCSIGRWTRAESFQFRWLRDGSRIKGATHQQYLVRPRDSGTRIGCRVTGIGPGGRGRAHARPVRIRQ